MSWRKLCCNIAELQLTGTLDGGQSFRWSHDANTQTWTGIFSKTVWKVKQADQALQYQILGTLLESGDDAEAPAKKRKKTKINISSQDMTKFDRLLSDYFRLDVDLGKLYKEWAGKDELFNSACRQFYGIRMLAQEPVENLFSFICSQNNHISRISGMVEKLCTTYGQKICTIGEQDYYSFPELEALTAPKVESKLRELGFGYRAKFIEQSASQLMERGGEAWLQGLRNTTYEDARGHLVKLHGIGPKVADCICLMSLGHLGAVPVDTHVHQIAAQHYLPHLRARKGLSAGAYAEIAGHFRDLYGPLASWAHTILFCADLKKFQQSTTEDIKSKKR